MSPHSFYTTNNKINTTTIIVMKNNVFKISILLVSLVISNTVNAQKIGIQAGYINPSRQGESISTTYLNGTQLGLNLNIELKKNFSLLTGVLYTVAYGEKKQVYSGGTSATSSVYGLFADMPLQVQYALPTSKNFKFFTYAGPNLNIGMTQKTMVNSTYSAVPSKVSNLYTEKILHRLSLQLETGGGIQLKNYILKAGYNFGVLNINKIQKDKHMYQNAWHVSFGYEW
jgi:hypothetical protein